MFIFIGSVSGMGVQEEGYLEDFEGSWSETWRTGSSKTLWMYMVDTKDHILKVLCHYLLSYLINILVWFYWTQKKVRGPSDFLSDNQSIGPQEWIYVKKIKRPLAPPQHLGFKVSANQRPVFHHMTIYWSLIGGFIDTHISQPEIKIMTQNFQDKILGVYQGHPWRHG